MTDESTGFSQAKARLEEIVSQVRKKDTSLEKSLDLLEEGVRLANRCTELIDQADWDAAAVGADDGAEGADADADAVVVQQASGDPDSEPPSPEDDPGSTAEDTARA